MKDTQKTPLLEKATSVAFKDERTAFRELRKRADFEVFARPSGADKAFPDFGLRAWIGGEAIDIHFEYKQDRYAQMGSMRDWSFDGNNFSASSLDDNKELMLNIMQQNDTCVKNAKKILKEFQEHCDPRITTVSSGMLGVIRDTAERREKVRNFAQTVDSYMLARIANTELGEALLNYYRGKFTPNPEATTSILVLMLGDEMYKVQTSGKRLTNAKRDVLLDLIGVSDLPAMEDPIAQLEVRIQPWGLNNTKAVRIDVMATYRLKQVSPGGYLTEAMLPTLD